MSTTQLSTTAMYPGDLPVHYRPSDADIAFYRDNGYWLSPKILSDIELEKLREHHQQIVEGHYETGREPLSRNALPEDWKGRLVQVNNAYWADSAMAKLALNSTIGGTNL